MRFLFWVATMAIMCAPLATAAPNPVPAMTVHLEPASQTVNASLSPANATFNGYVRVDKMPYQTVTVSLASATNLGWASSVAPAEMTFTSNTDQSFVTSVAVPAGTTGMTCTLWINATGRTYVWVLTQSTSVIVSATGTPKPPANQTNATGQPNQTAGSNQTGSGGPGSVSGGGRAGLSLQNTLILAAVILVAVGASVGWGVHVRRHRRLEGIGLRGSVGRSFDRPKE